MTWSHKSYFRSFFERFLELFRLVLVTFNFAYSTFFKKNIVCRFECAIMSALSNSTNLVCFSEDWAAGQKMPISIAINNVTTLWPYLQLNYPVAPSISTVTGLCFGFLIFLICVFSWWICSLVVVIPFLIWSFIEFLCSFALYSLLRISIVSGPFLPGQCEPMVNNTGLMNCPTVGGQLITIRGEVCMSVEKMREWASPIKFWNRHFLDVTWHLSLFCAREGRFHKLFECFVVVFLCFRAESHALFICFWNDSLLFRLFVCLSWFHKSRTLFFLSIGSLLYFGCSSWFSHLFDAYTNFNHGSDLHLASR